MLDIALGQRIDIGSKTDTSVFSQTLSIARHPLRCYNYYSQNLTCLQYVNIIIFEIIIVAI